MGTAERDHSTPKAAGVKANRTLNAVSDGAFAATRMNFSIFAGQLAADAITTQRGLSEGF